MKTDGKYYPVAVIVDKPIETDELAEQISLTSTVSKADVEATRIRFTSETRFANKGAAATRILVSGNVRWIRWGGVSASSSGSTDTGGPDGDEEENPLG